MGPARKKNGFGFFVRDDAQSPIKKRASPKKSQMAQPPPRTPKQAKKAQVSPVKNTPTSRLAEREEGSASKPIVLDEDDESDYDEDLIVIDPPAAARARAPARPKRRQPGSANKPILLDESDDEVEIMAVKPHAEAKKKAKSDDEGGVQVLADKPRAEAAAERVEEGEVEVIEPQMRSKAEGEAESSDDEKWDMRQPNFRSSPAPYTTPEVEDREMSATISLPGSPTSHLAPPILPSVEVAAPPVVVAQPAIVRPAPVTAPMPVAVPPPMSQPRYASFVRTLGALVDEVFVGNDDAPFDTILNAINEVVEEEFSEEEGKEAFARLADQNAFMISGGVVYRI